MLDNSQDWQKKQNMILHQRITQQASVHEKKIARSGAYCGYVQRAEWWMSAEGVEDGGPIQTVHPWGTHWDNPALITGMNFILISSLSRLTPCGCTWDTFSFYAHGVQFTKSTGMCLKLLIKNTHAVYVQTRSIVRDNAVYSLKRAIAWFSLIVASLRI